MHTRVAALALVAACTVALAFQPVPTALADEGYDVSVEESAGVTVLDGPTKTVEVRGDQYSVSSVAVAEPGADVRTTATVPGSGDYDVQLWDYDERSFVDSSDVDSSGTTVSLSTAGAGPGTYGITLGEYGIQAVYPVVIAAHDVDLSVGDASSPPAEVAADQSVDVRTTFEAYDAAGDAPVADATLALDGPGGREQVSLQPDGPGAFAGTLSDLEPGEYRVVATARGEDTVRGRQEILGVSEPWTLTVTEASNGDGDDGSDGGDGDGDGSNGTDTNPGDSNGTNPDPGGSNGTEPGDGDSSDGTDGGDGGSPGGGLGPVGSPGEDSPGDESPGGDSSPTGDDPGDGASDGEDGSDSGDGGSDDGASGTIEPNSNGSDGDASDDDAGGDDAGGDDGIGDDATPGFTGSLALAALALSSVAFLVRRRDRETDR